MTKEKQKLECEMAEMLEIIEKAREVYANDVTDHTENEYIREGLLDAGYRKQEWISVDERLPEQPEYCLVAVKVGERVCVDLGVCVRIFDCMAIEYSYEWTITNDWDEGEGCEITHWMPLPEAPNMQRKAVRGDG